MLTNYYSGNMFHNKAIIYIKLSVILISDKMNFHNYQFKMNRRKSHWLLVIHIYL